MYLTENFHSSFFGLDQVHSVMHELKFDRVFRPRLILQLHKYEFVEVNSNPQIIEAEANLLMNFLKAGHNESPEIDLPETAASIQDSYVAPISEELAYQIHSRYHYLLTPRSGKVHLGLFTADKKLLGLATFSLNDLAHLNPVLPPGIGQNNSLVLSRFVIFNYAPFNSPSYFLARSNKWIKSNMPGIEFILTYLDPNLGFDGAIYKAFNAELLAEEAKKRYLYYKGSYVSDRSMIEKFGTADFDKLVQADPGISRSKNPVKPLQIFAWYVSSQRQLNKRQIPLIQLNPKLSG